MGCLEFATTKHVSRWRKKGGVQDLEKGLHYLDKLIEVYSIYDVNRTESPEIIEREIEKFARANDLNDQEQRYILFLCTYESPSDLHKAHDLLTEIIRTACDEPLTPGTPDNGGHHSRQK
jgi:hypothetical protein